ncbi:MAG: hypothetical protein NVSMB1_15030 [Polyangiales bacterium]
MPPGGFLMIDKQSGQAGSDSGFVSINLLENVKGEVTVGDTFSTNGNILSEHRRLAFDKAVKAFGAKFAADVDRGIQDAVTERSIAAARAGY